MHLCYHNASLFDLIASLRIDPLIHLVHDSLATEFDALEYVESRGEKPIGHHAVNRAPIPALR